MNKASENYKKHLGLCACCGSAQTFTAMCPVGQQLNQQRAAALAARVEQLKIARRHVLAPVDYREEWDAKDAPTYG